MANDTRRRSRGSQSVTNLSFNDGSEYSGHHNNWSSQQEPRYGGEGWGCGQVQNQHSRLPYCQKQRQGSRPQYQQFNRGPRPLYTEERRQGSRPQYLEFNHGPRPPYAEGQRRGSRPQYQQFNRGPRPLYTEERRQGSRPQYLEFNHGPRPPYTEERRQGSRPQYQDRCCDDFPSRHERDFDQYHNEGKGSSAPPQEDFKHEQETHPLMSSHICESSQQSSPKKKNLPLNPEELVKTLVALEGQCSTADDLSIRVQRSEDRVIETAKCHKIIFSTRESDKEVLIELDPKVSLCSDFISQHGCLHLDTCENLHICKFFVIGFCGVGESCSYGHKLNTDHNRSILTKFYLNGFERHIVHNVLRKVFKGIFLPPICDFYNRKQGCNRHEKCCNLHICRDYVKSRGKCRRISCSFNHDILTNHCRRLLKRYGISSNETKLDILSHLTVSLQDQKDNQHSDAKSIDKNRQAECLDGSSSEAEDGRDSNSSDCDSISDFVKKYGASSRNKNRASRREKVTNEGKKTQQNSSSMICQSLDACGDVQVPEICVYAVNGKCIKKDCRYLHAKNTYHWQFERRDKWYNFRLYQSKSLEYAYREVSNDDARILPLDPKKEGSSSLLMKILGTDSWMADFQKMCIRNSRTEQLTIRRISTRSAVVFKSPLATGYDWYFLDEQYRWIHYDQVNSLGKEALVCDNISDVIEKKYVLGSSSPITIPVGKYKYKIDFSSMTQTNLTTNTVRPVRRRPANSCLRKKSESAVSGEDLPAHWTPMTPDRTSDLKTVDASTLEYQEVTKRLRLTLPTAKIVEIQRVQNPYLWRLFQYKKEDFSRRYNKLQMNEQLLFHGVDHSDISKVCEDNIDFRQAKNTRQDYGSGNYFSHSAADACDDCTPDAYGHHHLVLAEVVIGSVVKGSRHLTRPPLDADTNEPYDTTVDDNLTPTIFVKYDKEEYYPAYIIKISKMLK